MISIVGLHWWEVDALSLYVIEEPIVSILNKNVVRLKTQTIPVLRIRLNALSRYLVRLRMSVIRLKCYANRKKNVAKEKKS